MKSKFKDSLVGRTVNIEIYSLSFREMLTFKGIPFVPGIPPTVIKTRRLQALYLEFALYGGYPKIVLTPESDRKEKNLQQIIDTYIRKDIRDLAEIKDVSRLNRLLEVFASQSGNLHSEITKTPEVFFYDTGLMQMLWLKRLQTETLGTDTPFWVVGLYGERAVPQMIFPWQLVG